jgi:DNA invertase Pin-like site-specific DNA recombinase
MIAAIYARKSTEQNGIAEDAKSVTRQIEQAKAYALRHGWTSQNRISTSMTA